MLGEPAFAVGLADSQANRKLLKADGVARVLRVGAVNEIVGDVDIDATLVDVDAGHILSHPAGGVNDLEEFAAVADPLELLVTATVKQVFAVADIGGISDLDC